MDTDLPDFLDDDGGNITDEDWADGILESVDWKTIDQEMFGAEWIKEMEALDAMPTAELYYSSISGGFIPTGWQRSREAMDDVLSSLGLVGPKLLVQRGDELILATQLASHLGLELQESAALTRLVLESASSPCLLPGKSAWEEVDDFLLCLGLFPYGRNIPLKLSSRLRRKCWNGLKAIGTTWGVGAREVTFGCGSRTCLTAWATGERVEGCREKGWRH
jgi:hypothetical protein